MSRRWAAAAPRISSAASPERPSLLSTGTTIRCRRRRASSSLFSFLPSPHSSLGLSHLRPNLRLQWKNTDLPNRAPDSLPPSGLGGSIPRGRSEGLLSLDRFSVCATYPAPVSWPCQLTSIFHSCPRGWLERHFVISSLHLESDSNDFDCRTPEWLKKLFASVTKSERNGPVFRFFMDLGDAGNGR